MVPLAAMQTKDTSNREIINWGLFTGALILSWVTMFFFFTIPIGLIIWTILLVILFVRRSNLKWFLILLSGWTVISTFSFVRGTKDYFHGTASFIGVGLPGPESHNLDKDYRVWQSSSGCIVVGFEVFTHTPRNFAIQLCTKLFGYQRNVYTGVYPDRNETTSILKEKCDTISFERKGYNFIFSLENVSYTLKETRRFDNKDFDSSSTARAVIVNDELIIFRPITVLKDRPSITLLADKKNGKVFARYYENPNSNY